MVNTNAQLVLLDILGRQAWQPNASRLRHFPWPAPVAYSITPSLTQKFGIVFLLSCPLSPIPLLYLLGWSLCLGSCRM